MTAIGRGGGDKGGMPYVGIGVQNNATSLVGPKMAKAYLALAGGLFVSLLVLVLGKMHSEKIIELPKFVTVEEMHKGIGDALLNNINGENIKKNLRLLTKEPHQAGTKANERVAKTIETLYKNAGLQKVHTTTYDVLLSYPDWDKPNTLSIIDRSGKAVYHTKGESPVILPEEQGDPHAGHQWLAYSGAGTVTGDVVYCNYGAVADFNNIKKMGIDMKGKIALLRYGEGFRGDKVRAAQDAGAAAAILFSDPEDVVRGSYEDVYPRGVWMPSEGVQRGSIMKVGAYKSRTVEEAKAQGSLPSIPALPISYTTGYQILSRMAGRSVPSPWQGNINVTYKMGPGLVDGAKVTVDVKSSLGTKHIHNVIGYIPGVEEEDRYVILGNHFDAWVYGSIDPNSGTAILAEVARAMVETINTTQWRPARTIMFAAWDGEEYGLLGSNEFVEEFVEQLSGRAVAYLNMDCFQGNSSLDVNTIPSLFDVVVDVAKKIPNPLEEQIHLGRKTLYDTWIRTFPGKAGSPLPQMKPPSGGSDQAAFLTYAGIPSVDFRMKNATTRDTYPLYHTLYETPFLNEHLYDSHGFAMHRATGQFWAELARSLSDSPVLPLNASRLADEIANTYVIDLKDELAKLSPSDQLFDAKNQVILLEKTALKFVAVSSAFVEYQRTVLHEIKANPFNQNKLKGVNERLMMVEKCFVNPRGSPGAAHSRHVLFSISDKNSYAAVTMAAVQDAMEDFKTSSSPKAAGREVARQISIVYYSVNCAINTLKHFI